MSQASKILFPRLIASSRLGHGATDHYAIYYSSWGSHVREGRKRLEDWSHLNRQSKYYMTSNPIPDDLDGGHYLKKLTISQFLTAVGNQPWDALRSRFHHACSGPKAS